MQENQLIVSDLKHVTFFEVCYFLLRFFILSRRSRSVPSLGCSRKQHGQRSALGFIGDVVCQLLIEKRAAPKDRPVFCWEKGAMSPLWSTGYTGTRPHGWTSQPVEPVEPGTLVAGNWGFEVAFASVECCTGSDPQKPLLRIWGFILQDFAWR